MEKLEVLFHKREFDFDAKEQHFHCFPHTVNICTGHVIKAITSGSADLEPPNDHVPPTAQSMDEAIARDPIAMARAAIRAIRSSTARREAFTKTIVEGNRDGRFGLNANGTRRTLDQLQLLRDVPTRWDSVYHMINRFRYLRPVSYCPNRFIPSLTCSP